MIALLWSSLALAAPCPDVAEQVSAARAQFDDAELDRAKTEIAGAYQSLGCQTRVIGTEELLALYRLDGLVSLALQDRKGATYATIRAVAADHEGGAPPAEFGPDLAAEYQLWADRLGDALIYVRVAGSGTVWVDGRDVDAGRWVQVASGEHLIQVQTSGGLRSEVVDLAENHIVATGEPGPNPVLLPTPDPTPTPTPVPVGPGPDPTPTVVRRHPAAFFVTGVLAAGLGGGAIYLGAVQERKFDGAIYDEDIYGGCLRGQDCFASARSRAIRADADRVNALYGTGYGLCALGVGLVGVGGVGIKSQPVMLQVGGRF